MGVEEIEAGGGVWRPTGETRRAIDDALAMVHEACARAAVESGYTVDSAAATDLVYGSLAARYGDRPAIVNPDGRTAIYAWRREDGQLVAVGFEWPVMAVHLGPPGLVVRVVPQVCRQLESCRDHKAAIEAELDALALEGDAVPPPRPPAPRTSGKPMDPRGLPGPDEDGCPPASSGPGPDGVPGEGPVPDLAEERDKVYGPEGSAPCVPCTDEVGVPVSHSPPECPEAASRMFTLGPGRCQVEGCDRAASWAWNTKKGGRATKVCEEHKAEHAYGRRAGKALGSVRS